MTIPYLSVCSGIEAFSVAVAELDFSPVAFSEIEDFPSRVLAYRYPDVPNLGDMTKINVSALGHVGWLVGGTPCQSFSVAGMRRGLDDDRGNLTLEYVKLAHRLADQNGLRGLLWENVPGCLSDKTNAFGCFLGALVGHDGPLVTPHGGRWPDLGMVAGPRARAAWRILDSRYFGVPQRRRRVFVVADFGDGPDPASVLFEPRGQGRRAEASGEAGEGIAGKAGSSPEGVAHTLRAKANLAHRDDADTFVASEYFGNAEGGNAEAPNLTRSNIGKGVHNQSPLLVSVFDPNQVTSKTNRSQPADEISHTLPSTVAAPVLFSVTAFNSKDHGADAGDISPTLRASGYVGSHANGGAPPAIAFNPQGGGTQTTLGMSEDGFGTLGASQTPAVAFAIRGRDDGAEIEIGDDQANALRTAGGGSSKAMAMTGMQVRRLTPIECERLQGYPNNWTLVPGLNGWRAVGDDEDIASMIALGLQVKVNKKTGRARVNDPDGPRYKALGNSFTVEPVNWIMSRVQASLRGEPMPDWQPMRLWQRGPQ